MGSDDPESPDREKPAHQVELSDFFIGRYAVTQEVWQAVMNSNPSSFKG
jgi:formylglycine-generating enzyme required for sulfatase activity